MQNADYHKDPAISASHLHSVAISPLHYWRRFRDPNRPVAEPTAAMRLGSLVHCAVLEPDELINRYAIAPDRRTKEGKAEAAAMVASGIEPVSANDLEQAMAMSAVVRSHPTAALLLADGKAEQSFWFDDFDTGLRCKCRPDWHNGHTLIDLKTTTDASPSGFARAIAVWRYHVQAAHYLAGTFAQRFVFIAVEKSYPFGIGIYELDAEALERGKELRRHDLQVIADCEATGEWPGYGDSVQPLSLPGWALNAQATITSEDF
jgi:PDDEXK-like domain of unknown function (DUF3799)